MELSVSLLIVAMLQFSTSMEVLRPNSTGLAFEGPDTTKCPFVECQNGGTCKPIMQKRDNVCQCTPGFTGEFCEGKSPGPLKRKNSKVCYTGLGCFSNSSPYNNTGGELPKSPSEIGTQHLLYSKENLGTSQEVHYDDPYSLKNLANIDPSRPLKVIIHGFSSSSQTPWMQNSKDAILSVDDVNVYLVDWEGGAGSASDLQDIYDQAAANLRVVAVEIAVIIKQFQSEGLTLDNVHLIGHSLGAHTCGEVGKLFGGKIGRITGLDPASPAFEGHDVTVRLDAGDAQFVDAIHTDGREAGGSVFKKVMCGGLGTMETSGDLDVYVNGGESQPGCDDGILPDAVCSLLSTGLGSGVYCSHSRINQLFLESITSASCNFYIHQCSSYSNFQNGACLKCPETGCDVMGYHNQGKQTGNVYLNTREETNFCGFQHWVSIHPTTNAASGDVHITLVGTKGRVSHEFVNIQKGNQSSMIISAGDIGELQHIRIWFDKDWGMWKPDKVILDDVTVKSGVTGNTYSCVSGRVTVKEGQKTLQCHLD